MFVDFGSAEKVAALVGVAVSLVGVLLSMAAWGLSAVPAYKMGGAPGDEPTSAGRIEEATRSLQVAARLVDELQTEMRARAVALERLQAENAEHERLAAVRKEEAEAVSRLIESVISSAHAKLSRSSRRDQVLFFFAGLATSIPVQLVANWLS
jgi:hypothetical protein